MIVTNAAGISSLQIAAIFPESVLPFAAMTHPADQHLLNQRDVRRRFERVAKGFDAADFVHSLTRDGLLQRIEPLTVDADIVIDLGSATCGALRALSKRFRRARVVSVDVAHSMLRAGRAKRSWWMKSSYVQASAATLPFHDQSVDVIFANMLLPWVDNPAPVFSEIARVLRRGGVFAFASLGPDSLQEISRAWRRVDTSAHVNRFLDMHNLGDGLVSAGLSDPVLDVDRLTVTYKSANKLFADLTAAGGRNALLHRTRSLTGKGPFAAMVAELGGGTSGNDIKLDLELVYGHCWGAGPKIDPANYRIDATRIPLRRR